MVNATSVQQEEFRHRQLVSREQYSIDESSAFYKIHLLLQAGLSRQVLALAKERLRLLSPIPC